MTAIIQTRTAEEYAQDINGYIAKTAEMVVRIGNTFNEAKEDLPHGEFTKIFDFTPIGQRQAQKYMKIAKSPEVQHLLKNEPSSHLGVKQLYLLASGKEEKPSEPKELKWWEKKEIYESLPGMPFVDFYKRYIESELMQKANITYDMWALLNIPTEELDSIIFAEAEKNPGILEGQYLPFVYSTATIGKTCVPLLSIFGLGTNESLVNSYLRTKSHPEGEGFFINRNKAKESIYIIIYNSASEFSDFTFELDWMENTKDIRKIFSGDAI